MKDNREKEKAAALRRLAAILAEMKYYGSMRQSPPPGLMADALAIASLFPDADIASKLKEIENAEKEAITNAAAAVSQSSGSGTSWLDSDERRAFDELVAKDPLKAMADHFKDPRVAANRKTLNDIIDNKDVSGEKLKQAANDVMSEEMRYKRNAFFHHAPLAIEKLKQLGREEEQKIAESNLADVVKEEILDQVVLKCKKIRSAESRSTDHATVIEEDQHLICAGFKQAVEAIEHVIEGGCAAVGKAGHMVQEVIQDVLDGDVEQAARKVEAQQRDNEMLAGELLRRETEKKELEIDKIDTHKDQAKEEVKVVATEVKRDKKTAKIQIDEGLDSFLDDDEPQTKTPHMPTTKEIRNNLQDHPASKYKTISTSVIPKKGNSKVH